MTGGGWAWVVVAWLAGALLLVLLEERYKLPELTVLALWPVAVPVGRLIAWVSRRRRRCPVCRRVYHDRATMLRHLAAAGPEHDRSWRPPAPPVRHWP